MKARYENMNDKQEKFDELENIIDTLKILVKEINDKYYKKALNEIIDEAIKESDEVSEELTNERYLEYIDKIFEYENK